jgi:uncharacterized LabA/DUF88 family protein
LGASSGGLLLFLDYPLVRTIVYIDGFNLYYRALKGTSHKWLDIAAMSRTVLPPDCQIEAINYYTAHISGRVDHDAPRRQHAYLRAIATLPKVAIHFGNFLVSQKWAGLVLPPDFRPPFMLPPMAAPEVAYVWKTEEKGSDVNLGVHLVRDAFKGRFEQAAVLTNDTDLVEPVRIVTEELKLPVILLTPTAQPAAPLIKVATGVRHVQPYIGPCQLPDPVPVPGKRPIAKPANW